MIDRQREHDFYVSTSVITENIPKGRTGIVYNMSFFLLILVPEAYEIVTLFYI